ncbi:MAG: zinc ribbon domain-containing protein [Myxococcota bacterium]|nr:zinc ribbon domain-containing protein [Myxococcota bacterium]
MTCSQCGTMLQPNSGFCGACGRAVANSPPGQPTPAYPSQQPPSYQPPSYPPQQQGYPPQQQHGFPPPPPPHGFPPPPQQHGYPPQQQHGYPPPQQHGYPPPPGFPPPPPHGYPPPAQHGYPTPPPQQHGYPPPGPQGYPPPAQHGYPPPPMQQGPHGHLPPYASQGSAPLRPFPIILQRGMTRLTGQMFVSQTRLFFICESQKGGLAMAIGRGLGGIVGAAISVFGTPVPGQAAPVFDEPTLFRAVQEREGSLVMEPQQIKQIKHTMWTRGIWFNGKTYALPEGLEKELALELGRWCQANNVKSAGLL